MKSSDPASSLKRESELLTIAKWRHSVLQIWSI